MNLRIKEIRESKGLSQLRLAEMAGVTNAQISRIENGRGNPSYGLLEKISESLGVHISEIFPENVDASSAQTLARKINSLDPVTRAAIEALVSKAAENS